MQEHKTIQSYLDAVAEQIRWKRARSIVTAELERHLEDQRDAFVSDGLENAEELAVEEMGDPVTVGTDLDRIHRPKPQWEMIVLTIILAFAGVLLRIFLTAGWEVEYEVEDPVKALIAFALGCIALLAGYFLDYSRLSCHVGKIYLGTLAIGAVLLWRSPIISGTSYYARYITLIFPVVYALWLFSCRNKKGYGLAMAISGGVPLALFCCLVPYKMSLFVYLLSGFVMIVVAAWNDWFGIGRWKSLFPPLVCAGIGIVTYGMIARDWAEARLRIFLHPEKDPLGRGYQALKIREALKHAQGIGEGVWQTAVSQYPYEKLVPECGSDAFLTTVIYKLGWVPFLLIVLTFAIFVFWLVIRCTKQKSQLGRLIVMAVILPLTMQAMLSAAWSLGFTLISAPFPLIVGNLTTVLNMGLLGLALSVFRGDSIARNSENGKKERKKIRVRLIVERV